MLIMGWVLNLFTPTKTIIIERQQPKDSVSTFVGKVGVKPQPKEEPKKEEKQCKLDDISCLIYKKGLEIGMNDEQVLISIAIAKWETGNYTSQAFKSRNNVGGMMCKKGLIRYSSLDEGIEAFIKNLKKNYFDIGLNTLEKIQPKYCPVGAKNDPKGLNKHWLNGTNKMLEQLKEN